MKRKKYKFLHKLLRESPGCGNEKNPQRGKNETVKIWNKIPAEKKGYGYFRKRLFTGKKYASPVKRFSVQNVAASGSIQQGKKISSILKISSLASKLQCVAGRKVSAYPADGINGTSQNMEELIYSAIRQYMKENLPGESI